MKKGIAIRTISAIMAVVLLLCPLSLCVTASAADEVVSEFIVDILWETLKAWGVNIIENEIDDITNNVRQWTLGQLYEYITDELSESFDSWITGIDWIYDNFGRRMVNALGLDKFYLFAVWLQTKYGYSDNDNIRVQGGPAELDGIYVYSLPIVVLESDNQNNYYQFSVYSGDSDTYLSFTQYNSQNAVAYFISENASIVTKDRWVNGAWASPVNYTLTKRSGNNYYDYNHYTATWSYTWLTNNGYVYNSTTAYNNALKSNEIIVPSEDPIYINTGTIEYPPDDPNWDNGMSIIYYPDGSIGYIAINWPNSYSVDNLPAIVSTGTVSNPGLSDVFLPLKGFINTFSDGFGLMTQIVYNLPSPVVGMALAIMSAIAVFGVIRILKEH